MFKILVFIRALDDFVIKKKFHWILHELRLFSKVFKMFFFFLVVSLFIRRFNTINDTIYTIQLLGQKSS